MEQLPILKFLIGILCFFGLYLSLILFSIPLLLLFIYRSILSLIFIVYYKRKFQLIDCSSAAYSAWDSFANVVNITFFVYIEGPCNIEKLRSRVSKNILGSGNTSFQPYGILLKAPVQKFGFMCLRDQSANIDFNHHVRFLNADDTNKNLTEHQFLDIVAKLADHEWPENQPKWEFLVAPKVLKDDKVGSVIVVKFHHFYVDGITLACFLKNCVVDQPTPKLVIDPVNPPFPSRSFFSTILLALQIFFLGPYISLRLLGNQHDPVFSEGPLTGNKIIGRTKMPISMAMIKRIRKFYGCTTQSVFHSAFIGAFQTMAGKKRIQLPEETVGGVVFANFPYPDEFPRNNACIGYELIKCREKDPIKRLVEINKNIETLSGRVYAIKSSLILMKLMGLYPAPLIRYFVQFFKMSYYISNVPGMEGRVTFDGYKIEFISGTPPIGNCIRYSGGVTCYGGNFLMGFLVEKSRIIGDREEMEDFIRNFEDEIRLMDNKTVE
ncbi:unnamed protein product [Orchesella dallaii]|uniref:Diacylglycerol O-acyltransferase n=1 Tax=Orchesella dallaii TaxID=48710 RepID=A0ABP1S7C9_9HEXA